MLHRFFAAPLIVVALAVAACGGGDASPSASAVASLAPAAPSPAATTAESLPIGPSAAIASASPVAVPHGAPDLEATLPDRIGDQPIFKFSVASAELAASPAGASLTSLIEQAGGDPATTEIAFGNNPPNATFNLIALRGSGVDGAKLVDAYIAASIAGGDSSSSAAATIGSRTATRVVSKATNPLGDIWVYAAGDTMYGVQSKDEALVAQLIAELP